MGLFSLNIFDDMWGCCFDIFDDGDRTFVVDGDFLKFMMLVVWSFFFESERVKLVEMLLLRYFIVSRDLLR